MLGARELIQNVAHRRATFILILRSVRASGDLTEIFLRKPGDPCLFERLEVGGARITVTDVLPATIEALHDESALIAELTDVRVCYKQVQLFQQRRPQPLIVD